MSSMVHVTPCSRVGDILVGGLLPGQDAVLTEGGHWAREWYGDSPVYLAVPGSPYVDAVLAECPGSVVLDVDVEGLDLVADLPSLVDIGARIDGDLLWWEAGREPDALAPYLDDGEVAIEDMLDPSSEACRAAILATGSAASVHPVPAGMVAVRDAPPGPTPCGP